jgi:hypothetical protein
VRELAVAAALCGSALCRVFLADGVGLGVFGFSGRGESLGNEGGFVGMDSIKIRAKRCYKFKPDQDD